MKVYYKLYKVTAVHFTLQHTTTYDVTIFLCVVV